MTIPSQKKQVELTEEAMNEMFELIWKQDPIKSKVELEEWFRAEHIKRYGTDPYKKEV